jgi:hypothetical protein
MATPGGIQGQGSAPPSQIAQFRSDGVTAQSGLRLQFFTDSFSRAFGLPETRLVNMISEATPLREERPYVPLVGLREVHYSRPGLVSAYGVGSGPIRGVTMAPPVYGGGLFVVSGTTAYNLATGASCGTIPGTDLVRWASSRRQMVLVASGTAYLFDGANFNPISNGILPPVSDVAYLSGRFVYVCQGTDTFFYSEIDDAANETGLDFATAEASPDPNVAIGVLDEQLLFFGTQSVEFWATSSDATAPFQPVVGRGFQRGCAARGSVAFADNSLFWLGDNRVVYRADASSPTRISSSSIEDKLRQCANIAGVTGWAATFEGHEMYVMNVPGVGSYAYDCSRLNAKEAGRGEWAEWQSWNQATFRGQVAATLNDVTYVGDNAAGTVWSMQVGVYADGIDPLVRVGSCFIKIEEGTPRCDALVLEGPTGVGLATGQGSAPTIEMRYSDNEGRTFSQWKPGKLGAAGVYRTRAFWQRLGLMRAPGRLVEVRCADPVNVVFSHMELNPVRPAR